MFPSHDRQEQALLWREESRRNQPAGVITTVVKSVLYLSGAKTGREIEVQLDQHRALINNIEDSLILEVCKAFPAYKPEDLESLTWHDFLKRCAQAEQILGYPFIFVDPEEEAKQAEMNQKLNIEKEIAETQRMLGKDQEELAKAEKKEMLRLHKERQAKAREMREEYFRERGIG